MISSCAEKQHSSNMFLGKWTEQMSYSIKYCTNLIPQISHEVVIFFTLISCYAFYSLLFKNHSDSGNFTTSVDEHFSYLKYY